MPNVTMVCELCLSRLTFYDVRLPEKYWVVHSDLFNK